QLQLAERLGTHTLLPVGGEHQQEALGRPAIHGQRLVARIDDPVVGHARAVIATHLLDEIVAGVGLGQDLADPVGPDGGRGTPGLTGIGHEWEPISPATAGPAPPATVPRATRRPRARPRHWPRASAEPRHRALLARPASAARLRARG